MLCFFFLKKIAHPSVLTCDVVQYWYMHAWSHQSDCLRYFGWRSPTKLVGGCMERWSETAISVLFRRGFAILRSEWEAESKQSINELSACSVRLLSVVGFQSPNSLPGEAACLLDGIFREVALFCSVWFSCPWISLELFHANHAT
jgi:hypothetical protein